MLHPFPFSNQKCGVNSTKSKTKLDFHLRRRDLQLRTILIRVRNVGVAIPLQWLRIWKTKRQFVRKELAISSLKLQTFTATPRLNSNDSAHVHSPQPQPVWKAMPTETLIPHIIFITKLYTALSARRHIHSCHCGNSLVISACNWLSTFPRWLPIEFVWHRSVVMVTMAFPFFAFHSRKLFPKSCGCILVRRPGFKLHRVKRVGKKCTAVCPQCAVHTAIPEVKIKYCIFSSLESTRCVVYQGATTLSVTGSGFNREEKTL